MFFVIFVLPSVFLGVHSVALPSYIEKCSLSDPNLSKCMVDHATKAIPHLLKGVKEFNIPSLMPFKLPEVQYKSNNFKAYLRDVEIHGLDTVSIKNIKLNMKDLSAHTIMKFKRLNIVADYEMDGKILILPIKGKGPANITFVDTTFDLHFEFQIEMRKGVKFGIPGNIKLTYLTTKSYYNFANLFNGDKALGEQVNAFLNENSKEVDAFLAPGICETVTAVLFSVGTGILKLVPFDTIFLP